MDMRGAFAATIELANKEGMDEADFIDESLTFAHIVEMNTKIHEKTKYRTYMISDDKLGRWLGWAQAAVVASGCASLEEMKEINNRFSVELEYQP